jgi:glutamate-1-semialdehyde aminotransferase
MKQAEPLAGVSGGNAKRNPIAMAAGIAQLGYLRTPQVYSHLEMLSEKLFGGYRSL